MLWCACLKCSPILRSIRPWIRQVTMKEWLRGLHFVISVFLPRRSIFRIHLPFAKSVFILFLLIAISQVYLSISDGSSSDDKQSDFGSTRNRSQNIITNRKMRDFSTDILHHSMFIYFHWERGNSVSVKQIEFYWVLLFNQIVTVIAMLQVSGDHLMTTKYNSYQHLW